MGGGNLARSPAELWQGRSLGGAGEAARAAVGGGVGAVLEQGGEANRGARGAQGRARSRPRAGSGGAQMGLAGPRGSGIQGKRHGGA